MSRVRWSLTHIIIPLFLMTLVGFSLFLAERVDREQTLTREAWDSVRVAKRYCDFGLYEDALLELDETYKKTSELRSAETQTEIRGHIYLLRSTCELERAEHTDLNIDNITRAIIASQNALDILTPDTFPVLRGWALYHLAAAYHMRFHYSGEPQDKKEALELYKNSLDYLLTDNEIYNKVLSRVKRLEQNPN